MSKHTYLHIPEPCHEDWTAMTPVQQGRFCQSCAKTVVDFSLMSDQEILKVLSKAGGSTCGRFNDTQLQRPIVKEIPFYLQPRKLAAAAMLPAFIIAGVTSVQAQLIGETLVTNKVPEHKAQPIKKTEKTDYRKITGTIKDNTGKAVVGAIVSIKENLKSTLSNDKGEFAIHFPDDEKSITLEVKSVGYTTREIEVPENEIKNLKIDLKLEQIFLGGLVVVGTYVADYSPIELPTPKKEITGKVVDEFGAPVPYASIQPGTGKAIMADSNGVFMLKVRPHKNELDLQISSAGFEAADSVFNVSGSKQDLVMVTLKRRQLETVVVSNYCTTRRTGMLGGISIVRTTTPLDTANRFVQKLFRNEIFRAFPNPATAGAIINMTFKKEGDYSIQLFDNAGKLYHQEHLVTAAAKQVFALTLPASIGKGIYYLKATDGAAKKQYIDKIIVQ